MMKFMFMDGPFRGMVIRTKATKAELNSVPDTPIEFVTGPFEGLITRSLICYDRRMVEARELKMHPAPSGSYKCTLDISYNG
ncbi:hypothetical protein PP427_gp145 [Salmonella phage KM16]|uniref:hypothetical protein n=1 Tax=Salmonella phage KM16 TaxID=2797303 RepID=UPI002492750C|nr:hypothetical protein PP427_gp145 [Salmonella phage KM16]